MKATEWDESELMKLGAAIDLVRPDLPDTERQYLCNIGLPRKAAMPVEGNFAILPLSETTAGSSTGGYRLFQVMPQPDYLALGYFDFDEYFGAHKIFCLRQSIGGVYSFDAPDYPMRLVNSSARQFSESLFRYREFVNAGFVIANLRILKKQLSQIDARAMKDKTSYWYMLLDDLSENI